MYSRSASLILTSTSLISSWLCIICTLRFCRKHSTRSVHCDIATWNTISWKVTSLSGPNVPTWMRRSITFRSSMSLAEILSSDRSCFSRSSSDLWKASTLKATGELSVERVSSLPVTRLTSNLPFSIMLPWYSAGCGARKRSNFCHEKKGLRREINRGFDSFRNAFSVARLTRFEGRGHKKVPKGPPFAYVFWKISKQIIKGGSIGFFSSPPRFDGGGAWPPAPLLKYATARSSKEHCSHSNIVNVEWQLSCWPIQPWLNSKIKNILFDDFFNVQQRTTFCNGFSNRRCHFEMINLGLIKAVV